MDESTLQGVGEAIDRLITLPIGIGGGVEQRPYLLALYDAARARAGAPLALGAAQALARRVSPGASVVFLTGVTEPLTALPATDGLGGTAALARALNLLGDVLPIVYTERSNWPALAVAMKVAGLEATADEQVARRFQRKVLLVDAAFDIETARGQAADLLDRFQPAAAISIEKFGRNQQGVYHAGAGLDFTAISAKVDYLFDLARVRGILTVGVGDLGNEIGMGAIVETVRAAVATGTHCGCGCGGGIATIVGCDHLVVATVSNWGGYGIAAALAARADAPALLHTPERERRLLEQLTTSEAQDSLSGLMEPYVDGVPLPVLLNVVDLLTAIVALPGENRWRQAWYAGLTGGDARQDVQALINQGPGAWPRRSWPS